MPEPGAGGAGAGTGGAGAGNGAHGDAGEAIRRRDELLQVMYWMRGEGLGEVASAEGVTRLLVDLPASRVAADLRSLCDAGLAEPAGGGGYRLTPAGVEEGARRFAETFAEYTRAGHGVCGDPACDCHAMGPEACVHGH